uniref:Uncharacterized protein n=1 Tax=Sphaerodactylus townsendi TaxID=933632 RepID=A0ACB8EB45_9SAUR
MEARKARKERQRSRENRSQDGEEGVQGQKKGEEGSRGSSAEFQTLDAKRCKCTESHLPPPPQDSAHPFLHIL